MNSLDRRKSHNSYLTAVLKAAAALVFGLSLSGAASADRNHHDGHHHGPHHHHGDAHWHTHVYIHGGYVAPPYRVYPHWRDGYWYRGYRGGRFGWWWSTNGYWYPYPQPIYPYPEPYQPPVVWQQRDDIDADANDDATSDNAAADAATADEAAASAPQMWYYCRSKEKYFPYVSSCPEPWQQVPVTPDSKPSDLPADLPGNEDSE